MDASKMKTGPCTVILDTTDVGHTEGDVTFNDGLQLRERKSAQMGDNILDLIHTGQQPTITVRMAEPTLANLTLYYPEFTADGNDLYFGKKPGSKMSANAVRLALKPTKATGRSEDIVLFKAVVQSRADVGINSEGDRVYEVTFLGLADDTKTDGKMIGYMKVPS